MNSLKVLFRLYCHLGSEGSESNRDAMSLQQFRRFLGDAELTGNQGPILPSTISIIFLRVNREPSAEDDPSDEEEDEPEPKPTDRRIRRFPAKDNTSSPDASYATSPPPPTTLAPAPDPSPPLAERLVSDSTLAATGGGRGPQPLPRRPRVPDGPAGGAAQKSADDCKLQQHQFVHALIRVAWARYKETSLYEISHALSDCFALLMSEVVRGMAERFVAAQESITALCRTRMVRAAFIRHRKELQATYALYARADKLVADGRPSTMSLEEYLALVRETQLIDAQFPLRTVVEAFVLVNLEDELFINANEADLHTELVYDEFCELVVRIAREKLQPLDALTVPFATALDGWLTHDFMPRCRQARQRRLVTGGV